MLQWGIQHEIEPGGWFPTQADGADLSVDEVADMACYKGNHPSFQDTHGEGLSPAIRLVEEHVNKGFGMLFASREDAEAFLNAQCHPAPLGHVSKLKPDGTTKHHLIQDLKMEQGQQGLEGS